MERECIEAFQQGDKQNALRLLPQVKQPADIRTKNYTHKGHTETVSLLHLAASNGWADIVIDLITKYNCDLTSKDSRGRTPLHYATSNDHLEVVRYLINEQNCDPMTKDNDDETPLHIACSNGYIYIVQYLLSTGRVDPQAKNKKGITPVYLASIQSNSQHILRQFLLFSQCKRDFPVHTYTKLILTGFMEAGKTTTAQLIHLLAQPEPVGFFSWLSSGRITGVECLTTGIVPLHVESKINKIGNMVIYDFSGQPEYYSSHAAVLEVIMKRSAAIFICIVDLTKENISDSIHYWMSFIENACSSAQESSHIIIVGSHADLVKSSQELKKKSSLVESIAEGRMKQLIHVYKGFVSMDCRYSKTKQAHYLRYLLSTSQQAILSSQPSMSLYCHVLYAFLRTKLGKTGCTLQELISTITVAEGFPPESTLLIESLTTLSDKGMILFIQNQEYHQSSWVVVEKDALLREVNGTLFAPKYLKEYRQVASETGIVPITTLKQLFPQYSSEMLLACFESMEFCHLVDLSTLQATNLKAASSSHPPETNHLFFPSLVKELRPDWLPSPRFGWCLGCNDPHQFFSSRFLHVLLLRLSFTFPLVSNHLVPSFSIGQKCILWQNGICWRSVYGVSTIVEIIDHSRWIIVLVSEKSSTAAKIYSSVIRMILDLKNQLCSTVTTCECLISPSLLDRYPFDALPDTDLFDLPTAARSMFLHRRILLDRKEGTNKVLTDEALSCEPYYLLQPSSVCQLFNQSMASLPVPDTLLQEVLKYCQLPLEKSQDHKELRKCVDKLSIFAGRNPLEVAELNEEDIMSLSSEHDKKFTELQAHTVELKRLMKEKGSISMGVIQCMPFGPPRIGKTCIKDRLAGRKPKGEPARMESGKITYPEHVSMSTGAADDVMRLYVERSTSTTFQEQDEKWVQYDFNQEVISIVKGLNNLASRCTMSHIVEPLSHREQVSSEDQSMLIMDAVINVPIIMDLKQVETNFITVTEQHHHHQENVPDDSKPHIEDIMETAVEVSINPLQPVQDAFRQVDSSNVKALLENSLTIHFTDTGGQPEFQEIVPMLVGGPSLFFLVLSLALSLDHRYEVRYDTVDEELEPYISAFTVKDVLLQCLASIACMGTQRKVEGRKIIIKPKVLFIGTQLDLLPDSSQLNQINSDLWDAIGRQGLQHLVELNSRNQCIFAVNNYDESDASFRDIRKVVSDVAKREEEMYRLHLPVPFAMLDFYLRQPKERRLKEEVFRDVLRKYDLNIKAFELFLKDELKNDLVDIYDPAELAEGVRVLSQSSDKQIPLKKELLVQALTELNELSHYRNHVMTMEQFKTIAEKCGITSNDELKEALWALHHLLGTIRHYPDIPELEDTVITHQQLFFDIPTKLITSTFSLKKRRREISDQSCYNKFYEQGFFTMDDLNKLWAQEKAHLTSKQLVALLQYLHILGPFVDENGKNGYFLPCVLKHAPQHCSIDPSHKSIADPLLVGFDCGFTPNGVFSGLLVFLLNHCNEDGLEIKLLKRHLFCNQASLYVKPFIYLTIKAMPEYIHFSLHQHKAVDTSGICATVKAVITKGIELVASRLNYNVSTSLKFGFECTCDCSKPTHFTEYKPSDTPICKLTEYYCDVPSHYTQWFDQEDAVEPKQPVGPDTEVAKVKTDCLTAVAVAEVSDIQTEPNTQTVVELLSQEKDVCMDSDDDKAKVEFTCGASSSSYFLNVDKVALILNKFRFPVHKWKHLAVALKCADHTPTEENDNDRFVAIIKHWLSTDQESSWEKLLSAIQLSGESVVAENIAEESKLKFPRKEELCSYSSTDDEFTVLNTNNAAYLLLLHGFPLYMWNVLAVFLGVASVIQDIRGEPICCLVSLIKHWLSNSQNMEWKDLIDAIRMTEQNVVASNLAKKLGINQTSSDQT